MLPCCPPQFCIVLERWGSHVYGCKRLGHMVYKMNSLVQHTQCCYCKGDTHHIQGIAHHILGHNCHVHGITLTLRTILVVSTTTLSTSTSRQQYGTSKHTKCIAIAFVAINATPWLFHNTTIHTLHNKLIIANPMNHGVLNYLIILSPKYHG